MPAPTTAATLAALRRGAGRRRPAPPMPRAAAARARRAAATSADAEAAAPALSRAVRRRARPGQHPRRATAPCSTSTRPAWRPTGGRARRSSASRSTCSTRTCRATTWCRCWETLNRGETYVIEVTNMRADGTRFPVEVHSAKLRHDGRECMVAVARDLSSRHEAELRYRELMEVIDKGILVQMRTAACVYANAAAMRIFGIGEGESRRPRRCIQRLADGRRARPLAASQQLPRSARCAPARSSRARCSGLYHRQHAADLAVGDRGAAVRARRDARTRCSRCSAT